MSVAPETCPTCGKDISKLSPQARYGHIGGHKRAKAKGATAPSQAPATAGSPKTVHKATFTADVTPQKDLQSYKKPVEEAPKAKVADRGEAIEALITLGMERWNDFITTEPSVSGGPPKISAAEIKALASSVREVLEKHGGLEGVEGISEYLPEISLLIAAGLIGMKMFAGLRYRAGKRPGMTTAGEQAFSTEAPNQATKRAMEFFEQPAIKKEIERAMRESRVVGEA
jgi:hypothetical protein